MDGKQFTETLDGNIGFPFFNSPILYAGQFVIVGEILMTAVALLLPKVSEF